MMTLAHRPSPARPLREDLLLAHQLPKGLGRDEPVHGHRHAEEHLPGDQPTGPLRAIPVT